MKLEAPKSVLFDALQSAAYAVPNKSTLQILNNFLIRLEGNFLEVSATDLDLGVRVRSEVSGSRDGSVVVNARKLFDLIKVLPEGIVTIEVEDYLMTVRWSQKGKATITGFDASDFPQFPEIEEGDVIPLGRAELGFLADKTLFAVSTDTTRMALNGVFVEVRDSKLYAVATDGHRLGRAFLESETASLQRGIIIPPKALQHVLRAVGNDATIEIRISDTHILFNADNVHVVSKLIEGPYPKYESVIPLRFERTMQANRAEFQEIVKRISAFANSRTRQVRLSMDGGSVEISASDPNTGSESRESFAITHEGEGLFNIGFNGQYLAEVLNMCPSEEVILKMNSPVGACIIEPLGEGLDFFFLLMPLRLVEEG